MKIYLAALLLTVMALITSCEKNVDLVGPIRDGQPLTFEGFSPGDTVLKGQVITLTGTGFNTVEITTNGFPLTIDKLSPEAINITLPTYLGAGEYTFHIKRFDGDTLSTKKLTVFDAALSETAGPAGSRLFISGGGLNSINKIYFTSASGMTADVLKGRKNNKQLDLIVPDDAVTGPLTLELNNPSDPSKPILLQTGVFTVTLPTPEITSVSHMNVAHGQEITITGRHFGEVGPANTYFYTRKVLFEDANGLNIEGVLSTEPGSQSATQIKVLVPYFAVSGKLEVEIDNIATGNPKSIAVDNSNTKGTFFYINGNYNLAAAIEQANNTFGFIPVNSGMQMFSIALDKSNHRVFYRTGGSIGYLDLLTGISTEIYSTASVNDVVLAGDKLFWIENYSTINTSDLDGTNMQTVYSSSIGGVSKLALDPAGTTIFYTESDPNSTTSLVYRYSIADGIPLQITAISSTDPLIICSNSEVFIADGADIFKTSIANPGTPTKIYNANTNFINSIGVNHQRHELYWIEGNERFDLFKSNLDGSGKSLLESNVAKPFPSVLQF
ncbi:IPT/TIG domain-containing protein [Desertivirga brevis]|uniref:IPT/TIG domain-containing protein n=1 Tax=Desertivirga brevis TaxID=2810310 RepID=UPI001A970C92|nr:IPT/TIG domain-containing protein [Pedobacter sp. SYSU D00873]